MSGAPKTLEKIVEPEILYQTMLDQSTAYSDFQINDYPYNILSFFPGFKIFDFHRNRT
jgi:hypothetical protein